MIKVLIKHKIYIAIIIVLMIVEPAINSVLNFWLQTLFNSASYGTDKIYILRLLTLGFLLWMLKRMITYVMLIFRDRYICNMKLDIKRVMFKKLILKNTSHVASTTSSGEYISMFTNDITLLEQRFFSQVIGLVSAIFSVSILGYSFVALNSRLACTIIGFGVFSMLIPAIFSKKLNSKNMIYTQKIARFTQNLKEYIVAYPTIKNYSIDNVIEKSFDTHNRKTESAKFEADCSITLANSFGQLFAWFMQFIGVGFGLMMVIKGEIMIGTVIAAQSFAGDLALPIQNIVTSINSIRSVKNVLKKLENIANEIPDADEFCKNNTSMQVYSGPDDKYTVQFKGLSLNVGEETIIDDFSYSFESGKKYLIIGKNGAGKSSVFKVLKKWYEYCSGEITINGISISEFSNYELSKIVSYLNENVSLFSGTVKDNITLFQKYDKESLKTAINKSHMELNLDKEIIDEGRNISSGEKRRIEIVRALLNSSSILIFDEVVSTLDIETAYEIEKTALELAEKTVIFISHNFSGKLIDKYDEILIMDKGKCVAHGNYKKLMETSAYFRKICNIKFGKS